MDGFVAFLFIIIAIVSSLSKANKQKNGQAVQRTRQQTMQQRPVQQQTAQSQRTARQHAGQQDVPYVAEEAPMAPVEHHHTVQPTITVTPHTDDMFAGSMYAESTEGYDPCHEDELQPEVNPCEVSPAAVPQPAPAAGGLQLKWTGDEMVRAFVMSEVLTRPQDRRR